MLIDLFTLERDKARGTEIATYLEALAEDLLLSGAYDDTLRVTHALAERTRTAGAIGRDARLHPLDRLGESLAMRETAGLIADIDEEGWKAIRAVIDVIGVATLKALKPVVMVEEPTLASRRAEEATLSFGRSSVSRVASLVGDSRWFVQRNGAIDDPAAARAIHTVLRAETGALRRAVVEVVDPESVNIDPLTYM